MLSDSVGLLPSVDIAFKLSDQKFWEIKLTEFHFLGMIIPTMCIICSILKRLQHRLQKIYHLL